MPVTLDLEKLEYAQGYYNPPTVTRISSATATTDTDGSATAAITLPPGQSGSFQVTVKAIENGRELTDQAWLWVPGSQDTTVED